MRHAALFPLALIGLPAIAALHHFAVAYGYRGQDKTSALAEAGQVFGAVLIIETVLAACHAMGRA